MVQGLTGGRWHLRGLQCNGPTRSTGSPGVHSSPPAKLPRCPQGHTRGARTYRTPTLIVLGRLRWATSSTEASWPPRIGHFGLCATGRWQREPMAWEASKGRYRPVQAIRAPDAGIGIARPRLGGRFHSQAITEVNGCPWLADEQGIWSKAQSVGAMSHWLHGPSMTRRRIRHP